MSTHEEELAQCRKQHIMGPFRALPECTATKVKTEEADE